jgi:uncharacterized protein GlcG (DUF336 family)
MMTGTASAQTLTNKDISVDAAVTIATTAMADCKVKGFKVSAVVVGRVKSSFRCGAAVPARTMENAFKKAFTARTFRIPSGEMEKRLKDNPQMGAQYLAGFTTARGGLPIKIGDEVVGARAPARKQQSMRASFVDDR